MTIYVEFQDDFLQLLKSAMTKNWYESPLAVMVVTNGATLLGMCVTYFFNLKSEDKQFERKKKETIYQEQLNSLKEWSKIYHDIRSTLWIYVDDLSDTRGNDMPDIMKTFLINLDSFIKEHRFILPCRVIDKLEKTAYEIRQAIDEDSEYFKKNKTDQYVISNLETLEKDLKSAFNID